MQHLAAGLEVIRRAEGKLRSLLAEAAAAGDYDATVALAGLARGVSELAGSAQSEAAAGVAGAGSSEPISSAQVTPGKRARTEAKRAAGTYPRFLREADALVKIGWSKRGKSEYEHKAPHNVLLVLSRSLQRLAADGKRVTMEDLLPLRHSANGSEVPRYQAYLCLAWLRTL